eukprot:scaffold38757_cov13-Tisochrysis_lutea.AAC.1
MGIWRVVQENVRDIAIKRGQGFLDFHDALRTHVRLEHKLRAQRQTSRQDITPLIKVYLPQSKK